MNSKAVSVLRWIQSHVILGGIAALSVVLALLASNTYPTNNLLGTPERAVKQASIYASQLATGNIDEALMNRADPAVLKKLRNSPPPTFRDITQFEVHEIKLLPLGHHLRAPIGAEFTPPESRMQIMKLERRDSYFVITFAPLADSYSSSYIEADGRPLVVSVAVRYVQDWPETQIARWLAQFRNIKIFPNFIREGSSGDWYLIDYSYSFNLREYYDWLRMNEKRLYAESEEEKRRTLLGMKSPRWEEEFDRRIYEQVSKDREALNAWSYSTVKGQLEEVMHQLSQKQELVGLPGSGPSVTGGAQ